MNAAKKSHDTTVSRPNFSPKGIIDPNVARDVQAQADFLFEGIVSEDPQKLALYQRINNFSNEKVGKIGKKILQPHRLVILKIDKSTSDEDAGEKIKSWFERMTQESNDYNIELLAISFNGELEKSN